MMLLDGIQVPLSLPFYRDGQLYVRKLEHNVRRLSLSPVSALIAFDPRLEGGTLSDAEAQQCLAAIAETASAEKVLVAVVAKESVVQALALAQAAHDAGFDAIALCAPANWEWLAGRSGEAELLQFVRSVADSSPLPVMLWSGAAKPSMQWTPEAVGALVRHPRVIGMYDADLTAERLATLRTATEGVAHEADVTTTFRPVTGRMRRPSREAEAAEAATFVSVEMLSGAGGVSMAMPPAAPALKTRQKTVGFQVIATGAASAMPALLEAGVQGAAPLLASAAPQAVHEAYAAFTDRNPRLMEEKAARLTAADALVQRLGPAGVKHAADLTGYFGGWPRLPLAVLDREAQLEVERAFRELRS